VGRLRRFNKILFEFLSFGSPRAVVINFSVITLALVIIPTAFWAEKGDICIWHRFILPLMYSNHCPETGIFAHCYCPGCGLTHAFSRLFHGDLVGAYEYNQNISFVAVIVFIIYITNIYRLIKNGRPHSLRTT